VTDLGGFGFENNAQFQKRGVNRSARATFLDYSLG
jgi:hypothetical protein